MKYRMTFKEAAAFLLDCEGPVNDEYHRRFCLWVLDLMVFDDSGVTLFIPDWLPGQKGRNLQ